MPHGTLYLLPTGLGGDVLPLLPPATLEIVARLDRFIAENPKTARAFLKAAGYGRPLQHVTIETLDEHTPGSRLNALLQPLVDGIDCGLVSEAGCPAVADPGAALVRRAHAAGVRVKPLVGPSALLLAIMASGLNGQRFAFHGYLPVERGARAKRLIELERGSAKDGAAQMFIEAPYRNEAMLDAILETCQRDTLLCVATDLTLESEAVRTLPVAQWLREKPDVNRRPTVFLIYREPPSAGKRAA
jgi:16S rRNA (cytidine1402-2'-O)-methyltransferase